MKHYFYRHLSQCDSCQFWKRVRKKKWRMYSFERNNWTNLVRTVTTMLFWKTVNETQGDLMQLFLIELLQFLLCNSWYRCPNWTDLERLAESVFVVELKISLNRSLRTNCLREFRYQINKSSIDWFNVTKYLTFLGTFREGSKLITDGF